MKQIKERKGTLSLLTPLLVGLWLFAGCQASELTKGTVVLKVVNSITGEPVEGVVIVPDPPFEAPAAAKSGEVKKAEAAAGSSAPALTTGADGTFKKELTAGAYVLKLTRTFYKAPSPDVVISVIADREVTQTVKMVPDKPIGIEVKGGEGNFGEAVEVKAKIEILDGASLSGIKWEQTGGPKANLAGADSDTVTVTLPDAAAFKAALVAGLKVPDRALVQAIDPHALDGGENISLKITLTSSTGSNTGTGKAGVHQSFKHTLGIGNVPVGIPVLVHSKKNAGGYSWSLTTPGGSATLDNAGSQDPAFTPDTAGQYVAKENNTGATINVYAGNWQGAVSGKNATGRPNSDACTSCHNGSIAPDNFSPWRNSGHAEIFTNNINTYASYKETCLECHSVGWDKDVANGGIDEASDFQTFIDAKLYGNAKPTNWDTILATYPATARMTNIQCENCHGPNTTALHNNKVSDPERVSLGSGVCGACHGEPPSHGRYQQWEESHHADYTLAISRGQNAHCGRCHSGQGFLKYIKQGDLTKQLQGASGNATADEMKSWGMGPDSVHPVTCVVCHDPHAQGKTSGEPNTATVRVEGKTGTLAAGFGADGVGHGALCMTCHNSRNGLHNNDNAPTNFSAPHAACQTDVFMGQNAYFVGTGVPSKHANIENTCTSCHMVQTDPPKEYSRDARGTNHTFEANGKICSNCHGNKDTNAFVQMTVLQEAAEEELKKLADKMAAYLLAKLGTTFYVKDYMPHQYNGKDYDVKSSTVTISKDNVSSIESTEPHGQQGFFVNLKSAVNVSYTPTGESAHTMSLTKLEVQLGDFYSDSAGKTTVVTASDNLVKAGWNYFLLHAGSGEGVHNPTFTFDVIEASLAALK